MDTQNNNALVTIIIPFYQKDTGLLRKCVNSILKQKGYDNYYVIIVDDGSPVAATDELVDILKELDNVRVILQKNAGPGAARNRGLDNLPENTRYVAFLDSDDWWEETFLKSAVTALEQGYDLFFSNSQRFGFDATRFDWQANKNLNLVAADHIVLEKTQQLYAFSGDFFNYALVRSNIISTSAMVYRLQSSPKLRFSTKLFNGQDRLFKLSFCQQSNKVAFSPKVLVREEQGVNIYDSAKWGTEKSLVLVANYIKLSRCILNEVKLNNRQKKIITQQLNESRYSMLASILHLLKSRVRFDWQIVFSTIKIDPFFLLKSIPNSIKLLLGRNTRISNQ